MMSDVSTNKKNKLLIIEDDDISRDLMKIYLFKYYEIEFAKDGQEAMTLFLQNDYRLIITDINLGLGKNGIDLMKEIRRTSKGKGIPIIAITAYSNFGDRQTFLAAGFDNYIAKPFQSDELYRSIIDTLNMAG